MSLRIRIRSVTSLIAVAALVAACGTSAMSTGTPSPITMPTAPTASPAATPQATASPSPTPAADVSKQFASRMMSGQFRGAGPISGTMTVGALEIPIEGSLQIDGKDSSLEMQMEIPGTGQVTSAQVTVGDLEYSSQNGGPWFVETSQQAAGSGLASAIGVATLSVKDRGVVDKLGQQLHHLVPADGATLSAAQLGMTDPSLSEAKGTLEFYARDDGSLAVMSLGLAWTLESSGLEVPATMAIDFSFDEGASASIQAPDDVWERFTSQRFAYSIGYPSGYAKEEGRKVQPDLFAGSATEFAAVVRERQPKAASGNLDAYVAAFTKAQKKLGSGSPESSEQVTVLGQPARRLTYHEKINGAKLATVYTLLIRGRNAYWIAFCGPSGYETEILGLHEDMVATFQLTGG